MDVNSAPHLQQGTAETSGGRYVSPTLPNVAELAYFGLFIALLVLALALPWTLVWQANRGGLNFDTWKLAQAGGGLETMLPLGAEDYLMGDEGLLAVYGNGMWAMCKEFDSQRDAVAAWRKRWSSGTWPDGVLGAGTRVGLGQWLAFANMSDGRMLEWVSGRHMIRFFAWNDQDLTRMILASPMIDAKGEPRYGVGAAPAVVRLLRFNAGWTAFVVNVLTVLVLCALYWQGVRSVRKTPAPGGRRVGREALRTRLLALNSANVPVQIEEQEPYHLIVRWRVEDPEIATWLAGRNMKDAWQLDIYLGDRSTASLLETHGRVSWDGRVAPPRAHFSWNYLRSTGESQRIQPAKEPDAVVLPCQSIEPQDFRRTLEELLLGCGWSIRPLLFRPLVWEYR
jgi:hypothetical protein